MKIPKLISILIIMGLPSIVISGCGQNNTPTNSAVEQQGFAETNGDQPTKDQGQSEGPPDLAEIERAWENSAHSSTFLVDRSGQNNTCAQCHAPINWMPSMDTIPESCFTCKFELEDPPPYIAEDAWENIPCKVCHELNKRDEVQPEYQWLEIAAIDEYAKVNSTTELCQKCHTASEPMEGHVWQNSFGAHQDQTCTDCHNPHDGSAGCLTCHSEVDFSTSGIAGHDPDHESISCMVCHDGSGLTAGLDSETNLWVLLTDTPDGSQQTVSSHEIVLESNCSRCHFTDNPWELSIQQ